MHPRAEELAARLSLVRHPEGGMFREIHRAALEVAAGDGSARPASTHIYFLLVAGEYSRWHRVAHDEVWQLYEGAPLELAWIAPDWSRLERRELATPRPGCEPVAVVPGGSWQMAVSRGDYSLLGCTVAPGFEFADFTLLADDSAAGTALERNFPGLARFTLPRRP